ncbi:hypothetical protein GTQ99_00580 [Kineococcus sp. T13]|uniref:hypothetical protein n=1 Tax=Kineococcus vitellinus TaxID=2696565 RepID=UPI001412F8DC|nr:hypothetical protein [Kineococcus vitellinus]NAZ73927.1 hypothetical protein [Kineococcus vitellinus]
MKPTAGALHSALSGEVHRFFRGDFGEAVKRACQGGSTWYVAEKAGIRFGNGAAITWREVQEVIHYGIATQGLERYNAAWTAYVDHATRGGPPNPWVAVAAGGDAHSYYEDPENQAYWEAGSRIAIELHDAATEVLAVGLAREAEQEQLELFEL